MIYQPIVFVITLDKCFMLTGGKDCTARSSAFQTQTHGMYAHSAELFDLVS